MAKMQLYFLAVVMWCSPAVQVLGRVIPHAIDRKPISVPKPVEDGATKPGKFAKHVDHLHGTQTKRAVGSGHTTGFAYADEEGPNVGNNGGVANITLRTNGKGHGNSRVTGESGSFARLEGLNVVSGAVVNGTSKSNKNGFGRLEKGNAFGSAARLEGNDQFSENEETQAGIELVSKANGKNHGSSTTKGAGFAGGRATGDTVSGLKGTTRDHATNKARSGTSVVGTTVGNNVGDEVVTAHGHTGTLSVGSGNHATANGKGKLHGGSRADEAFATIEVDGTSKVKNRHTRAAGEGTANAITVDTTDGGVPGGIESYADSSAGSFGREASFNGGAKASGTGVGHTGVIDKTGAFSKSDTSVNTGSTRPQGKIGTKASAGGKHVAAIDNAGSVSAGGHANLKVGHGIGNSTASGSAFSSRL